MWRLGFSHDLLMWCSRRVDHNEGRLPTLRFVGATIASILALFLFGIDESEAFKTLHTARKGRALPMIGNFLAGVTGLPPPSLLDEAWTNDIVQLTSLENVKLECAYKATRDGWSAIDFHQAVDERGSGIVVALSRSGAVFGGFNPLGWRSTDDYSSSNAAFLWFVNGNKVTKSPILPGGNAAIFDYATGGPCFGAADLHIGSPKAAIMGGFAGPSMEDTNINAGNLREGSSSPGGAYDAPRGWPAKGKFQLAEVEVYVNANVRKDAVSAGWWPF